MAWQNNDGLYVTFGTEKAQPTQGGRVLIADGVTKVIEVDVDYTDLAASYAFVGSASGSSISGIVVPKGAIVEKLELVVTEAFTVSGGTADSVVFSFGLGKRDAAGAIAAVDYDEYTTTSFTGAQLSLEQVGNVVTVDPESTGAGDGYGVATTENALLVAANTTQATNVLDAGSLKLRLYYR